MAIIPSLMLKITIITNSANAYWNDFVNPGPWDGVAYRWNVIGKIEQQPHGSDSTPTPFFYGGGDVKVGDWITDLSGRTLQIIQIKSSDDFNISMVVEDIDLFNIMNDANSSGFGGLQTTNSYIFSMAVNGTPDIYNSPPGTLRPETVANIESRFDSRNLVNDYVRVFQTNNGFNLGDFIQVDLANPGGFKLCASTNINQAVGIVNTKNTPGTNWFTFKPFTEIINDVLPPLVGNYGDIFYMDPDNPGKITKVKPASNPKPVFIRLETDNRAVRLNAIVDDVSETKVIKIDVTADNQVEFVLPADASEVLEMSINGLENKNYTFDNVSKQLTFDPVKTGYGVETSDEVIFTYNKN